MEFIDQCLQKTNLSPTLKYSFSKSQDLLILDCLNEEDKWIRLNITPDLIKQIDENFINLLDKGCYEYEMPGSNTWTVSLKEVKRFLPEMLFEQTNKHGNSDGYVCLLCH